MRINWFSLLCGAAAVVSIGFAFPEIEFLAFFFGMAWQLVWPVIV